MSRGGSSMRRVTSVMTDGQKMARKVKKNVSRNFGTSRALSQRKRVRHSAASTLRLIMQWR